MRKIIYAVVLAMFAMSVHAANLTPAQDKAVKAYVAKEKKERAANREEVEVNNTIVADLNGDGKAEVVLDVAFLGGTWWSNSLVILSDKGKGYQVVADEGLLGSIQSIDVKNGLIHVNSLQAAPNDPRCCPSIKETTIYQWNGTKLLPVNENAPATKQNSNHAVSVPNSSTATVNNVSNDAEWKFASVRGLKLAGITNGVTGLKALNVYCEGNVPTVAAAFTASQPNLVRVEIQIGHMIYPFVFAEQRNSGGYRLLNLSKSAFPKGLISGQQQALVKINGVNHGVLSLRNAGTTSRAALSACYRY